MPPLTKKKRREEVRKREERRNGGRGRNVCGSVADEMELADIPGIRITFCSSKCNFNRFQEIAMSSV